MSGLLDRFRNGDRQALARILSHVENQTRIGYDALRETAKTPNQSFIIGLTGPPGAGKSSLANQLVKLLRQQGQSVAVLAIDPSSPLSGGATLGDRIRLLDTQSDEGVYIRSMASRGRVGGLAVAAFGAATVLSAFGFQQIILETVGAGQDETDIAALADTVVLLQTPAGGDAIQTVKAGILEVADVLVVNKADLPGSQELSRDLRQMVGMAEASDWTTPVIRVTATTGDGVDTLFESIRKHQQHLTETSRLQERRSGRSSFHAMMMALASVERWLVDKAPLCAHEFADPASAAEQLLDAFAASRRE